MAGIRLSKNYLELNQVSRSLHESKKGKRGQAFAFKCLIFSCIVGCESLKKTSMRVETSPSASGLICGGWAILVNGRILSRKPFGRACSPFASSEVRFGAQWAIPYPGRSTAPLFSSSPLAPLTWDGLAGLLSFQTSCTCSSSLWTSTPSSKGTGFSWMAPGDTLLLVLSPRRAAVSHEPLVLWIWVWVESACGFVASLLIREIIFRIKFLGERSLFSLRSCSPAWIIVLFLKNHIPAKNGRLVHQREKWDLWK